jgi:hypothetical protein
LCLCAWQAAWLAAFGESMKIAYKESKGRIMKDNVLKSYKYPACFTL